MKSKVSHFNFTNRVLNHCCTHNPKLGCLSCLTWKCIQRPCLIASLGGYVN